MEITHEQWFYRNYAVHNPVSGTIATAKKEELLLEIECQQDLRDAGLLGILFGRTATLLATGYLNHMEA